MLYCDEKTSILDCGIGVRLPGLDIEERDFVKENGEKELYIIYPCSLVPYAGKNKFQ